MRGGFAGMREALSGFDGIAGTIKTLVAGGVERDVRTRAMAVSAGVPAAEFRNLFDRLTIRGRMSEAAAQQVISQGAQMTGGDALGGVQRLRTIAQSVPPFVAAQMGLGELRATGDVGLRGGLFGGRGVTADQMRTSLEGAEALELLKVGIGQGTARQALTNTRQAIGAAATLMGVPMPVEATTTDDLGGW